MAGDAEFNNFSLRASAEKKAACAKRSSAVLDVAALAHPMLLYTSRAYVSLASAARASCLKIF